MDVIQKIFLAYPPSLDFIRAPVPTVTDTMDATIRTPASVKTEGDGLTVNESPSPIEDSINPPSVGGYKGTFARFFILTP